MQPIPQTVYIKLMGQPWQDAFPYTQIWDDMCFQGQCATIVAAAKALNIQNIVLTNTNAQQAFGLMTIQPAVAMWQMTGQTADGLAVSEYVGNLIDRQTKPNPFIDGTGGPNLKVAEYAAEGFAQLYWGN